MAEQTPELLELITLQRQTLAKLNGIVEAIAAPREIVVERDEQGRITGARVATSEENAR